MKKRSIFFLVTLILFSMLVFPTNLYAASGYEFKLDYTGDIIANKEKDAKVLLVGTNGTLYTNVRIKVDVTGPATPTVLATDSAGKQYDIVKEGYWGPPAGFAVQGDFTNTTPIKDTFPKNGTYSIKLSLLDVNNANQVITSRTIQVLVLNDVVENNNTNTDNTNNQTTPVEELPQTGISILDYTVYGVVILAIVAALLIIIKKSRNK